MEHNPEYSSEFPLAGLTILMADDEERLRQVVVMMLEELGSTVISVASCEDAIAEYSKNRDGIDIVMLDLRMGGMDGDEAFHVIRSFDPESHIVLSSGVQPDHEFMESVITSGGAFIEKPFDMDQLGRTLASVVGRHIDL